MERLRKFRIALFLLCIILTAFTRSAFLPQKNSHAEEIRIITGIKAQKITLPEYKGSKVHTVIETLESFGYNKNLSDKLKIIARVNYAGLSLKKSFDLVFPNISKKLSPLFKSVNYPAQNAKVKFNPYIEKFEFTPEKYGESLAEEDFYSQIFDGLNKIQDTKSLDIEILPVKITPSILLKDIENATNKGVSFQTSFDGTNDERANNIKIALLAINGDQIKPGEVFSFNKATGKRSKENGYEEAKIISGGIYVNGSGGGVCQVSTTLFNAALLNGLEIVESSSHTFPAHYVKLGQDAMVSQNTSDLKIKNPFNAPVFIKTEFLNNAARITFFGLPLDSTYHLETVLIEEINPPEPKTIKNEKNKYNDFFENTNEQIVKVRNAHKGYKTETYLIETKTDGTAARKLIRKDFYKPFSELWVERN